MAPSRFRLGAADVRGLELTPLPETVRQVASFLETQGHPYKPVMLDAVARTAQQAASALGVSVGQIAKSIVFRRRSDDVAVLVITSGDQRVDEKKLEAWVCPDGQGLGRANAEFVKSRTGFSIGGVSPLAHATASVVMIDRSLFRFDEIWAAAGHPHAVFRLSPQDLARLTGAPVEDLAMAAHEDQSALRRAIVLVAMRARTVGATAEIPSPCISVCRMNEGSGLCDGCFRTRAEIAAWSSADDDAKRATWTLIERRMAAIPV